MKRLRLPLAAILFASILSVALLTLAPPVAAHQQVPVGSYTLTVGWRVEPAVVGGLNGLDLGIQHTLANNTTVWVVGVENNLNATITTGPVSALHALAAQDNRPGWYTFDIIPTLAATYSVRIQGTLNTTHVDVTVALDPVDKADVYQFPIPEPGASDLQASINQLNAQLATLQTLLTILIAVAVIALAIGAASLGMAVRGARAMRRSP